MGAENMICQVENSIPCDALQGFRVVELTEYVAAPICGRMLADYGAEVIKIEKATGDIYRQIGNNTAVGANVDENPLFDILNSGKKSVVLNLKEPEGMEQFHKLLETADIFLTNNRMVSLKKLGIDPESLAEKYPKLVYGLITGYGIDGPEKDAPGFDSVAFWGRSGFLRSAPYEDSGYPMPTVTAVGDTITGTMLLTGLLSALLKRERTGRGDFVTASLLGSAIWVTNSMVIMTQPKYGEKYPISRNETNPYACGYKCADGEWLQVGIVDYARYMPKLMEVLGVPDMIKDPRFATKASAKEHWPEMLHVFEPLFLTKTSKEWKELIDAIDVVCCILPRFSAISEDQQAWANGNLESFEFRNHQKSVLPCPPVRFGSTGTMRSKGGPLLGEHTEEVLGGL